VTRRLQVEADGGSRGNPGPAGYGAVVRDAQTGEVLAEDCASLGRATNNVAEYSGLIAGLRAAGRLAPGADTEVRMDSKLVVEQMSGRWQIKHPDLRPLAAQARQAAGKLGRITYTWVPRARNTHADRLANQAMDAAEGGGSSGGGSGRAGARAAGAARASRTSRKAAGSDDDAPAPAAWPAVTGPSKPSTVLLLRHGETTWSPERRFAGRTDIPLTGGGERQAAAVAQRLSARAEGTLAAAAAAGRWAGQSVVPGAITAIVASPLQRTRQTAAPVSAATGLPVVTDPGWAEVDFGEWEGLTRAETIARWAGELAAWDADTAVAPPGGESFDTATGRVLGALDALLAAHPGECVLVVTHMTPIKIVLMHALLANSSILRRLYVGVASLCETDWYPDSTGLVRTVNDTAHLLTREWQPPMTRSLAP
jgi:ribonuclease H / adenosylcobalamin/alpha-ribazole phosphatase